jgi:hypothetical protein
MNTGIAARNGVATSCRGHSCSGTSYCQNIDRSFEQESSRTRSTKVRGGEVFLALLLIALCLDARDQGSLRHANPRGGFDTFDGTLNTAQATDINGVPVALKNTEISGRRKCAVSL